MPKVKKEKTAVKKITKPKIKAVIKTKKVSVAKASAPKPKIKAVAKSLKAKPVVKKVKEEIRPVIKPVKPAAPEIKVEVKPVIEPIHRPHKPEEKLKTASHVQTAPAPEKAEVTASKEIELELPINVKDLAIKLQEKSSVLIKHLMSMGVMTGINQSLDEATLNNAGHYPHAHKMFN